MSSISSNSDSEKDSYESISENESMSIVSPSELKHIENKAKLIETKTEYVYDSDCLRKKSNWSKSGNAYKFDHPEFDAKKLKTDIPSHSSKLDVLIKKIKDLDKKDMEKDGRHYKHFIFSDVKTSSQGAKLIASALLANGMKLAYNAELKKPAKKESMEGGEEPAKKLYKKIELLDDKVLRETSGNNFYLLTSIGVYDQPISVTLKKSIFKKFNERPDNIHGELVRFIIMDSGYKEGVDLFDIKYIHMFEPSINMADQRQIIGRGTRTCGQKGLEFHPTQGWPLHVFIYDVEIPEQLRYQTYGTETLFDLYLKSMNIDLRLINFQHDLERATIYGSVDYELNRPIHTFVISGNMEGGNPSANTKKRIIIREDLPVLNLPEQISELTFPPRNPNAQPMDHDAMRQYVRRHFSVFKWEDVKMENNCLDKSEKSGGAEIVKYTPTQNFVRHFFTPEIPLKGMLLYHSPGTGKTCSAIAAASSSFEQKGYTILWVTRTTLKSDIWKNMFDQICSQTIQEKMKNGDVNIDKATQAKRLRMLSNAWSIRPMSYKQFSNMILKSNALYKALVKKNGEVDPLRKTLLIIDEAHKLYGGTDLSSIERPDMKVLENAIQQSYEISGMDSVKVLLMTATPITQDPMELIKLINLTKPSQYQMPSEFDGFARKFLDEHGRFTPEGEKMYLDSIAGHISYLNREKDARQFAQPIIKYVKTPLVDIDDAMKYDNAYVRAIMDSDVMDIREKIAKENNKIDEEIKDTKAKDFDYLKEKCDEFEDAKSQRECNKIVKENIREIMKNMKESVKDVKEAVNELKEQISFKKELKKEFIENIKKNIEGETGDYEKYKDSLYYSIKKCGKKITNLEELRAAVKDHPAIAEFDNQLHEVDKKIGQMNQNLQNTLLSYKKRMVDLKKLAKEDLSQLEKNVVNLVMKDERKTMKKRSTELEKEHVENVGAVNKTRKAIEKKKRKKIMGIRKTMRQMVSEEKRVAKEIAKEEKRLKKTQKRQQSMVADFKNDFINELTNKYTKIIEDELENLRDISQRRIEEEAEKQAKKEQNKILAEKRAQEKQKKAEEKQKKTEQNPK
jgi:hypothetical protein